MFMLSGLNLGQRLACEVAAPSPGAPQPLSDAHCSQSCSMLMNTLQAASLAPDLVRKAVGLQLITLAWTVRCSRARGSLALAYCAHLRLLATSSPHTFVADSWHE